MSVKNTNLVSNFWFPEWLFKWEIKIQYYKTDSVNDHKLWKEIITKCIYQEYQQIEYGSSRGSRDMSAEIDVIVPIDVGIHLDELRIIFEKEGEVFDYKVDNVERYHDINKNFKYCHITGH